MSKIVSTSKPMLNDVVILRVFFIIVLVLYHSFAPYCGSWGMTDGVRPSAEYYWVGKISYSFGLALFVFISGYLLGYNTNRKPDQLTANKCIFKKAKRLLIPSVVFSSVYFLLFFDHNVSALRGLYTIVNGCGHLWFLPMLFWCFVGVWMMEKLKVNPALVLGISVVASILAVGNLPMQLSRTALYFIYFYVGYGIQRGYFDALKPHRNLTPIIGAAILWAAAFAISEAYSRNGGQITVIQKVTHVTVTNALYLLTSLGGLFFCYWLINYYEVNKRSIAKWLISLSGCCYGIYIYQQFILQALYYHTQLPQMVGQWLPWVGFFLTLIASYTAAMLSLKTRLGRFLIG